MSTNIRSDADDRKKKQAKPFVMEKPFDNERKIKIFISEGIFSVES
jgi:hypothetical protein